MNTRGLGRRAGGEVLPGSFAALLPLAGIFATQTEFCNSLVSIGQKALPRAGGRAESYLCSGRMDAGHRILSAVDCTGRTLG
jgi:hypothetical protein